MLEHYLDPPLHQKVNQWIRANRVELVVSKPRYSKLGDFRPALGRRPHRISLNATPNIFEFRITLVHEMAHLETWKAFGKRVPPHGFEWKAVYHRLYYEFLQSCLPEDLSRLLEAYLSAPARSRIPKENLVRAIRNYGSSHDKVEVGKVGAGRCFKAGNGRIFRMIGKHHTRYKCVCLDNDRLFLFSRLAQVTPCEPDAQTV